MMAKSVGSGTNIRINNGDWSGWITTVWFNETEWTPVVIDFIAEKSTIMIEFNDSGSPTSVYVDNIVVTKVEA